MCSWHSDLSFRHIRQGAILRLKPEAFKYLDIICNCLIAADAVLFKCKKLKKKKSYILNKTLTWHNELNKLDLQAVNFKE
jgi:hypothetical protein